MTTSDTIDMLSIIRSSFNPDKLFRGLPVYKVEITPHVVDSRYLLFHNLFKMSEFYIVDTFNDDIQ